MCQCILLNIAKKKKKLLNIAKKKKHANKKAKSKFKHVSSLLILIFQNKKKIILGFSIDYILKKPPTSMTAPLN